MDTNNELIMNSNNNAGSGAKLLSRKSCGRHFLSVSFHALENSILAHCPLTAEFLPNDRLAAGFLCFPGTPNVSAPAEFLSLHPLSCHSVLLLQPSFWDPFHSSLSPFFLTLDFFFCSEDLLVVNTFRFCTCECLCNQFLKDSFSGYTIVG